MRSKLQVWASVIDGAVYRSTSAKPCRWAAPRITALICRIRPAMKRPTGSIRATSGNVVVTTVASGVGQPRVDLLQVDQCGGEPRPAG